MNILWFLLLGALAGWIAGEIVRGHGFGILGNIVVGIIGALIGGLLTDAFGLGTYGFIGSLVMATLGAVILLFLLNMFSGRRHSA